MAEDQNSRVFLQEHSYGESSVEDQGTGEEEAGSSDTGAGTQTLGEAEGTGANFTGEAEVAVSDTSRTDKGTGDDVKDIDMESGEDKSENKSKAAMMDTSTTDASDDDKKYPFVCGICKKKFEELSEFCTHFKNHDNVEKYFHSCKKDKKAEMFQALEMMEKVDSNLYECGVCNTKFPSMCHLHEHMLKEEKMTDYRYNNEKRLAYCDVKKKGGKETLEEEDEDEKESDQEIRPRRKRKDSMKAKVASKSIDEEKTESRNTRAGQKKEKDTIAEKSVSKTPYLGRRRNTETEKKQEKETEPVVTPRGRGRPRKYPPKEEIAVVESKDGETPVKRGRGRPRKSDIAKTEERKEVSSKSETEKKSKKSDEKEKPMKSPRAKRSIKKDSSTESEDQMLIDSPRSSSLYGLRGKRKMNKRYSDFVTDKRLSTFSKSDSDSASEDEIKQESKRQKMKKEADGKNSPKKPIKKLQEKTKSTMISIKKEAPEDKNEETENDATIALDGTEHVPDEKDESEIMDDKDADEEDDAVDDPPYDPKMEETKESPVKVYKQNTPFVGNRLVPCSICGKGYDRRRIKKHMISHKSIRDSQCDICGKSFKCKAHMNDHKRIVHIKPRLSCKICLRVFKHMKTLEQHLLLHVRRSEIAMLEEPNEHYIEVLDEGPENEEAPAEKNPAEKNIKTEENGENNLTELAEQLVNLNNDILNENKKKTATKNTSEKETNTDENQLGGDTLYCKKCEEEFDSIDALREHLAKHNIYKCEKCGKIFRNLSHLKRHYIAHKVERKFKCEKCFSSFKSAAHVRDHDRIVHMRADPYVCNICGDSYKTERHLWSHKNMHLMKSNKYYSKEVVEQLQKEEMERSHEKEKGLTPKTTICDTCGKEICTKRYKRHQDTHKKEKDIQCDMCPKKFSSVRYMKDHRNRSHLSKKQATCDICGINFKANYIDKHRLIHGPRDKACPHCGKLFTTDFYLKVHLSTHAEKKQYKCTMCEAAFSHKPRLDIHMNEKHGLGEKRPCQYCNVMFSSRQKARMHERKVHEGFKPPYRDKSKYRKRAFQILEDVESEANDSVSDLQANYQITVQEVEGEIKQEQYEEMYVEQVEGEEGENIEHILEIPENAEQCQILLYPNGTFRVLNVNGGEEAVQIITTEDGEVETVITEG